MLRKTVIYLIILVFSASVVARPKISVQHKRNAENLAEVQVTNQTAKALICYVAIDGYKIFFRLQPRQPSKWYKATDPRFNHKHFSVWCDPLSLHPEHQPKAD